jgi:hypothetical protein
MGSAARLLPPAPLWGGRGEHRVTYNDDTSFVFQFTVWTQKRALQASGNPYNRQAFTYIRLHLYV